MLDSFPQHEQRYENAKSENAHANASMRSCENARDRGGARDSHSVPNEQTTLETQQHDATVNATTGSPAALRMTQLPALFPIVLEFAA